MKSVDNNYPTIPDLPVSLADGVLSVTFNRPESLNSLSASMLVGLVGILNLAAVDPRVRVVQLSGAGSSFSSGAGIGGEDFTQPGAPVTPADILEATNDTVRAITKLPQPVVAVIRGAAAGVAVSLALACDIVLASETAFFALTFTKIGLMPDGGASALIAAAAGRVRAMRMALLAQRIPAPTAYDWGLISGIYPDDALGAEADKIVASLAAGPATALGKTKSAINSAALSELNEALEREKHGQQILIEGSEFREGIAAFQQRRTANFAAPLER